MTQSLVYLYRKPLWGTILNTIILGLLLYTTVLPVEASWSNAEVIIAWSLPFLGVYALIVNCLLRHKTDAIKLSLIDLLIFAWCLYYFSRVWLGAEFYCATQFMKDISMFFLYFILRGGFSSSKLRPIYIVILIILCGSYEASVGLFQIFGENSRHYNYAVTGTFLNPGPFSAYLVLAIVLGLVGKNEIIALIKKAPAKIQIVFTVLYFFLLALVAIVLPSTWSRSAFVALVAVCLLVFRKEYWRWKYFVLAGVAMLAFAFYFLKQGSADGRLLTWTASLTSWCNAPWLGAGVGGFRYSCAEGISQIYVSNPSSPLFSAGGVAEYPFCDFLKTIVEQGVLGAFLCLTIVIIVLYNTFCWSKPLFYGLISLLIISLFSYPFEFYPYRTIAVMIAAAAPQKLKTWDIISWKKKIICLLLECILIISSYCMAREIQNRYNIYNETKMISGLDDSAFINDYYELLPKESDNQQFLFNFAKTLRNAGRYNDSNAILRQGASISNDPMFYLLQGNNYKDMKCFEYSEKAYMKAYAIMPNRLYPLYQLMMLYKCTNQKEKMKSIARRIVEAKPKVTSPATEKIKHDAKTIL